MSRGANMTNCISKIMTSIKRMPFHLNRRNIVIILGYGVTNAFSSTYL